MTNNAARSITIAGTQLTIVIGNGAFTGLSEIARIKAHEQGMTADCFAAMPERILESPISAESQ